MKSILTKMKEPITTAPVGQTRAGSAEAQPAGDSQLKAANCRWTAVYCHPILRAAKTIRSFVMPENLPAGMLVYSAN